MEEVIKLIEREYKQLTKIHNEYVEALMSVGDLKLSKTLIRHLNKRKGALSNYKKAIKILRQSASSEPKALNIHSVINQAGNKSDIKPDLNPYSPTANWIKP